MLAPLNQTSGGNFGVTRRRGKLAGPIRKTSTGVGSAHLRPIKPCNHAAPIPGGRVRPASVACRATQPERPESPGLSTDASDLFGASIDCPFDGVSGIVSQPGRPPLLTATPRQTLQAIIPMLQQVTGLPVVDGAGRVVGVISRKDIIKQRQAGGSMSESVDQHMTAPAMTVPITCSVQQAADLMLSAKIRRLPVVDDDGRPLGVVSRSDVFRPLMESAYEKYMKREVAAVSTGAGIVSTWWSIKYLYDGECAMCQSLKAVLQRQDKRNSIRFVDISDPEYEPSANMGVEFEDAMDTIHAIRPNGTVLLGTEALRALFDTVGLGWAVRLSELPLVARLVEIVYDFLSANRQQLSMYMPSWMDGVIAVKRLELSKKEVTTCGDVDEGCLIEW